MPQSNTSVFGNPTGATIGSAENHRIPHRVHKALSYMKSAAPERQDPIYSTHTMMPPIGPILPDRIVLTHKEYIEDEAKFRLSTFSGKNWRHFNLSIMRVYMSTAIIEISHNRL